MFNEAAKAQGRKVRGNRAAPSSPDAPSPEASAATVPEGSPEAATQTPPPTKTGFVPTADHIKAVENARTKARTDVEQEFRQTYGDPTHLREIVSWAQRAATDRRGFLAGILQEALADPELAPLVAGSPSTRQHTQSGPTPDQPPQPDFRDANGNLFYSAKALEQRDQWLMGQMKAEILGQVEPDLETIRSERQFQQAEREQQLRASAIASTIGEAKRTWPYFDRFKSEIETAIRQMPLTDGHPASEGMVLRRAYDQVVLPKLSQLEQDRVLADLKKTANASSLNPAATGAPSGIPKTVRAKEGGSMAAALAWAATQQGGR